MRLELLFAVVTLACGQQPDANHQTKNFSVYAATPEAAKEVGQAAESLRKDLAKLWVGKTLPDWPSPCRIDADIKAEKLGGFTDVTYSQGKVFSQKIVVRGPLERVLKGSLPHELTHVIFAHHFGSRPPRWADEGGAILSEGGAQGAYQSRKIRAILMQQRQFPLRDFLAMQDYPDDVACLYAQGHSVSEFLVAAKGHKVFMEFVQVGMQHGWDRAAKDHFGHASVEDLEKAWVNSLDLRKASASQPGTPHGEICAACPL